MITREQIYAATDRGLKIFAELIPNVEQCVKAKKPFRLRPDDDTPSTFVFLSQPDANGNRLYLLKDQGNAVDKTAKSPLKFYMEQTGMDLGRAISTLAVKFGLSEDGPVGPRPDIRKEPATADQADGTDWLEMNDDFTDAECRVMAPNVKPEHLRALNWHPVRMYATVKDRTVTKRYSNESYPIFARECWYEDADGKAARFYKLYEPKNPDKAWRFKYSPKGAKPANYVNGLAELIKAYDDFNAPKEKAWNTDPTKEGREYPPQRLPEAVLCSGERDALCARSMGYMPLWLNSETSKVSDGLYHKFMKYVEVLYNVPDIDSTGKRCGTDLALQHLDLHTAWLPDSLRQSTDARGKRCKDLRDWMELNPDKKDFERLIRAALPAKFWTKRLKKETGEEVYSIDFVCLKHFLRLNGFYTYIDESMKDPIFVKVEGCVVNRIQPRDVRAFVDEWAEQQALPRKLRNLIASSPLISPSVLEGLTRGVFDFTNATHDSQRFYLEDSMLEVTADGIKLTRHSASPDYYVWDRDVIRHRISQLPAMFAITEPREGMRSTDFDIQVHEHGSNYFRYLINASRIYWRKELEHAWHDRPDDERRAYADAHKFDIAGPMLDEAEIREQKRSLISKIFTIGYLLHRYKSRSRSWAPMLMDNLIGENDQCNGGSGKSFMILALSKVIRYEYINSRKTDVFSNQFWAGNISDSTALVLFDDLDEHFPIKEAYNLITGDLQVNPKNQTPFTLAYEDGPKFVFTTNYVPKESNGSTVRRMLYSTFSDYYHARSDETDYNEERTIREDFGFDLFDRAYPEAAWDADINFMMQCLQFYLKTAPYGIKIEPEMGNIIFRRYLRNMSDNFRDWAENYFSPANEGSENHLNCMVPRQEAFEDFKRKTGLNKTTAQGFKKALEAFCYTSDYIEELNPEEMRNSSNRIQRKYTDANGNPQMGEMIYIRTVNADKSAAAAAEAVEVETLPF